MNRRRNGDPPARLPAFKAAFNELIYGKTYDKVSEETGMSRATVGFYASGQRVPDAIGLKNIAEKFNVSADWLLGLSDVKELDAKRSMSFEDALEICKNIRKKDVSARAKEKAIQVLKDSNDLILLSNVRLADVVEFLMEQRS